MKNRKEDAAFDAEQAIGEISQRVKTMTLENRALFQRLLDEERRFRRVAKAVWMVQEEERRRLARELHDGIGQTLTALKNQLANLHIKHEDAHPSLVEGLADSVELVSMALNDTRELSRLLRPAVLDDLGLEAALSWLARTLGKRAAIKIHVACEIGEARFTPDIETMVFRIVQESLTNVIKHGRSANARIRLSMRNEHLIVTVADEGAGFDVEAAMASSDNPSGLGLRGMRDRAELFGGRLRIRSTQDEGTVVELSVPYSSDD